VGQGYRGHGECRQDQQGRASGESRQDDHGSRRSGRRLMSEAGQNGEGARSGAPFLILAWAGIAGAAGVALAAVAAHKVESPALATAATMLAVHAAAAVGIAG